MCGPKFCSMEITQQIRDFADGQGLTPERAVEIGLAEKAEEYREQEPRARMARRSARRASGRSERSS